MSTSTNPKMSFGSWAFSFGPFADDPWPFTKLLKYAADAGFDGVEINGFRPHPHPDDYNTPAKCKELVKEIEDLGLGISGYAPDFTDTPPDRVDTAAYLGAVDKCLRFCSACNISALRIDTVSPPDELEKSEYETNFARLAGTWHTAAERCAQEGVQLVWEFEPGFWLNKPSEVLRTVGAVGHGNFKLLFDTSHAYMGAVIGARQIGKKETLEGGVAAYASMLGNAIGHLHLIDSDGTLHNDETSTHTPFGEGNIDFKGALEPIKSIIGEMPWWTADFCFCADTEAAAKAAPAFMRNLAGSICSQ